MVNADYCIACSNSTVGYCVLHPPLPNPLYYNFTVQQSLGWQCPSCYRCFSPSVTQCTACGNSTWTFGTVTSMPGSSGPISLRFPPEPWPEQASEEEHTGESAKPDKCVATITIERINATLGDMFKYTVLCVDETQSASHSSADIAVVLAIAAVRDMLNTWLKGE